MKISSTIFLIATLLCSISCNLIKAKTETKNNSFLGLNVKAFTSGKFYFVSQSNFEDYMKAANVGMIKRNVLLKEKHDITVEENGGNFTISFYGSLKNIRLSFKVDTEFEADLGFDITSHFLPSIVGPNIIQLKDLNRPNNSVEFNFSEGGLTIVYTANEVVGTRNFKRA